MLRHRRHRLDPGHVEPDLPITPMLDMSFQLLAFFVTTYNPGPVEAMLALALPKLDGGLQSTLTATIDDEGEAITVQVHSTENGQIDSIIAFTKTTAATPTQLGKDPKSLGEYLRKQIAELKGTAPGKLTVEFGDDLIYQNMITVIDVSRRAGFEKVSPAPLNKKKQP